MWEVVAAGGKVDTGVEDARGKEAANPGFLLGLGCNLRVQIWLRGSARRRNNRDAPIKGSA